MKILIIIETSLIFYLVYRIYKMKQNIDELKNYKNDFFKSKQAELLFYLTKLDGKQRNRMLGLKNEHYSNNKLAKKWYRDLVKYVHPDTGGNEKAFSTLKKIYDILIEED